MTTMAEPVRAPRRRADLIRDDRLPSIDMRTRTGKRFSTILASIRAEFGDDVDPIRAGEVARLRMLGEAAQRDALVGKVSVDRVVRISNLIVRAERQMASVGRAKPGPAGQDLHAYLAELAARDADAEDVEPEIIKTGGLSLAAATEHVAPDLDIAVAEAVEP
jgi:hypothetical protein